MAESRLVERLALNNVALEVARDEPPTHSTTSCKDAAMLRRWQSGRDELYQAKNAMRLVARLVDSISPGTRHHENEHHGKTGCDKRNKNNNNNDGNNNSISPLDHSGKLSWINMPGSTLRLPTRAIGHNKGG